MLECGKKWPKRFGVIASVVNILDFLIGDFSGEQERLRCKKRGILFTMK